MALQLYKIATVEVGSAGASTIDFTSIPQGYTDILIKASLRTAFSAPDDYILIKPNNSTSNLTFKALRGDGSSASSTTLERPTANGNTATASAFGNLEIYFPNYSGSTNKPFSIDAVSETNGTLALTTLNAHLWSDTTAINRVVITVGSGSNFVQYSTATLYGIL